MKTQIVQTVTAGDMRALRLGRDAATDADLVELRLDGVGDLDVAGALRDRVRGVIVTCRPVWEGGAFDGDEATRQRILNEAVALGAEFVDVERRAQWRPERRGTATRLVLSDHDFNAVPTDVAARVAAMRQEGADVVKLAATPQSAAECLTLRDAAGGYPGTAVVGMGGFGRITRALPSHFGSCWTYAGTAAPGQYSASDLVRQFRVRQVTGATEVYAVTGRPLEHSASPAMHNAAFQALGRDAVYVPLQATSVEDAAVVASALGIRGMSVTAPFKRGWAVTLDDEASRALGVVNTLKAHDGHWLGRNVDGEGFLDGCDRRRIDLSGARALVIGAGGAARAVGRALIGRGSVVAICARRAGEATALASAIGATSVSWPPEGDWDLLVNATPVGTWPDESANPLAGATARAAVVYDLVYNPEDTALLQASRAAGAQVIGGLEMLAGQAARQCAWWTGQAPPVALMADAARAWIAADNHSR
jgi:3-dehydroquinate dehydratase/shikimate dehydrogenase